MAIRSAEAIVLRNRPFRSSSLIATFFTKDSGKIWGVAKGIKLRCDRADYRHNCYLEPLTLNKIVYYEKKRSHIHLVSQCDLLNHFQAVRQSVAKLAAASHILELVDKAVGINDKNAALYDLLLKTLRLIGLEKEGHTQRLILVFWMRALSLVGFMPRLDCCAHCGNRQMPRQPVFSAGAGGLVCERCSERNDVSSLKISRGAVRSMLYIAGEGWEGIGRFRLLDSVQQELKGPLEDFIKMHIGGDFKTLEFMEKMTFAAKGGESHYEPRQILG